MSDVSVATDDLCCPLDPAQSPILLHWDLGRFLLTWLWLAIIACGFVIMTVYTSIRESEVFLWWSFAICFPVVILMLALISPQKFKKGSPGLLLTKDGFIHYSISPDMILWKDVARCSAGYLGRSKILHVYLKPGVRDGLSMNSLRKRYFSFFPQDSLILSDRAYDCSFDDVIKVFEKYVEPS